MHYPLSHWSPSLTLKWVFSEIPTDLLCTEEEVCNYLLALDATKACGSDGLSAKMLKGTAASIAPAVTKLFNISLWRGELPSEWKHALITPIPKISERSNVSNYRPISLAVANS